MNKELTKKLAQLENLLQIQRQCVPGHPLAPYDTQQYMRGMFNGMMIAHSVFSNLSPYYIPPIEFKKRTRIRHKCMKKIK